MSRVALASWAVASIEWYDFFVYGTASALVFPAIFFPSEGRLTGVLLSFATFGVAFVARPVGGIVFGHIGDTRGRRLALVCSLLAMGCATSLIGLLPSYATTGGLAPVLLVVLRFVQGVAVGGQQGGVIVYATERSPADRRGMYGSAASAGAPGGTILANVAWLIVFALIPTDQLLAWGWRLPFLVSLLLIAGAIVVQLRLEESAVFERPRAEAGRPAARRPIVEALRAHPRSIVLATGCYLSINLNYYMMTTFILAYATNSSVPGLEGSDTLVAVLVASGVQLLVLPVAGLLSDRFGRRPVFLVGAALLGGWQFLYWPLIDSGTPIGAFVALVVGLGILHSTMYGPQPAFFAESFTTDVRYSGVSLGVQLGSLLGGAFAPLVSTALLLEFRSTVPIAVYSAIGCVITLVCASFLGRRAAPRRAVDPAPYGTRAT